MKSGTNVHTNQIISTDREKTHWNENSYGFYNGHHKRVVLDQCTDQ